MAQEQSQLKARIEAQQEGLKDNFEEIENRIKDALDWRKIYQNNTALALTTVAVGGLLVAILLPKTSAPKTQQFMDYDEEPEQPVRSRKRSDTTTRLATVLDNTVSAMLGVATDKLQDFMGKAIPGFRHHYADAQDRRVD